MTIAVLPPDVAAKIAAGEVIERPASIVKELIENALDAGARRIRVEIESGGTRLIRVTDDGNGLPAEELPIAFLRHATSKLKQPEDLAAVTTLGFRGEALPSIAAAAEVEFASRPDLLASGARLRLDRGEIVEQAPYAGARGTVVTVRDLFALQPARRKFLRSPSAESAQIATLVGLSAIAYPEVAYSLHVDGRRNLITTGSGDRREATAHVYGAETASALLDLSADGRGELKLEVAGLISPPDLTRANRTYISVFVNRRWVQPRRIAYAIEQAYESQLMTGRHPIAVLDLRLPPAEVDVNVHPTKSEVRFLNERAVHAAAYHAIRERLAALPPAPHPSAFATPTSFRPMGGDRETSEPMPLWTAITRVEGHDRPAPLDGAAPRRPGLPILRVVGQTGNLYIVAEGPDGMYLLDQHAAHERVLYEQIVQERDERGMQTQGLLSPASVELTPSQDAALASHAQALNEHGFELEPFGPRTYLLRGIPAVLAGKDAGRALSELLDDLAGDSEQDDRRTQVAMTVACHASVRAGKTMAMEEMRELLRLLEACQLPGTCPHGRPTMIHLSSTALEREFRRR